MARKTYATIVHKLIDTTAKADAVFSMTDKLAASSYAQIADDIYTADTDGYGTLEPGQWLLDKTKRNFPADLGSITWGLWTNSMTDAAGAFAVAPALTVTFSAVHTSAGLTFQFVGDTMPSSLTIEWYATNTLLASATYIPDKMAFYAPRTVENYNKVKVTFAGTKIPERRVKIAEIDYGGIVTWEKDAIIEATAIEEVDPSSIEITVDALDFSVHDESAAFNMLNPEGVYVALQRKQALDVSEYVNGTTVKIGRFYMDEWDNDSSAKTASFSAISVMGLFDSIPYYTSPLWAKATGGTVLAHIFAAAGYTTYTIDAAVAATLLSGYANGTVRTALHDACVALRAACLTDRNGGLIIKRLPSADAAITIEKGRKLGTPSRALSQTPLVNSLLVTSHTFAAGASETLYSATLAIGTHTVRFPKAATGLTITGGTIAASGVLYARVTVTTAGTVTITGTPLRDSTKTHLYESAGLTNDTRIQKAITENLLIGTANADAIAQYLYADYQRRIVQRFTLLQATEKAGDNVNVSTALGNKMGVITKMDMNLAGGFISDVEVRG